MYQDLSYRISLITCIINMFLNFKKFNKSYFKSEMVANFLTTISLKNKTNLTKLTITST